MAQRLFCLAAALLAALAGCGQPAGTPFQIATNVWIGYEPLYLARSLGKLDPREFRLVEMSNSTDSIRALRTGMVQAAALTLDEAYTLLQDGVDLRLVLVTDVSSGADAILGKPGVDSLPALKGKRVGVENATVGGYLLSRALESVSLRPEDLMVLPLTEGEIEEAFRKGAVDAVVTFDPVRSRLLAAGAVVLFDSSRIPNEIFDVLVVRAEAARQDPDRLERLRAAWFEALAHLQANPRDAIRRMAPREAIAPEVFQKALSGLTLPDRDAEAKLRFGGIQGPARRLADLMLRNKLLVRPVDPSRLLAQP